MIKKHTNPFLNPFFTGHNFIAGEKSNEIRQAENHYVGLLFSSFQWGMNYEDLKFRPADIIAALDMLKTYIQTGWCWETLYAETLLSTEFDRTELCMVFEHFFEKANYRDLK